MNILPKKRWHVRTKANIERVRQDEAKAAAEEEEKQRRALLAEQEARTALLREKAKLKNPEPVRLIGPTLPPELQLPKEHVNFFTDLEEGRRKDIVENEEHKRLKKKEQEEYEKKIGYLTYLGQSSLEDNGYEPVYKKASLVQQMKAGGDIKSEKSKKNERLFDPMRFITNSLGIRAPDKEKSGPSGVRTSTEVILKEKKDKKVKKKAKKLKRKRDSSSSESEPSKKKRKKMKKRSKGKEKKKKKKESSESESEDDMEVYEKRRKLAVMREERLRREAAERERQEKVLRAAKGLPEVESTTQIRQKYSSQFNPGLARQNK